MIVNACVLTMSDEREHILDETCWCGVKLVETDADVVLICHRDGDGNYPTIDDLEHLRPEWQASE